MLDGLVEDHLWLELVLDCTRVYIIWRAFHRLQFKTYFSWIHLCGLEIAYLLLSTWTVPWIIFVRISFRCGSHWGQIWCSLLRIILFLALLQKFDANFFVKVLWAINVFRRISWREIITCLPCVVYAWILMRINKQILMFSVLGSQQWRHHSWNEFNMSRRVEPLRLNH